MCGTPRALLLALVRLSLGLVIAALLARARAARKRLAATVVREAIDRCRVNQSKSASAVTTRQRGTRLGLADVRRTRGTRTQTATGIAVDVATTRPSSPLALAQRPMFSPSVSASVCVCAGSKIAPATTTPTTTTTPPHPSETERSIDIALFYRAHAAVAAELLRVTSVSMLSRSLSCTSVLVRRCGRKQQQQRQCK